MENNRLELPVLKKVKVKPSNNRTMKVDVKKTDEVLNRLVGVFGTVLGVFLSRLIVTLTPNKQATLVNWLIGLGSTGFAAVLAGKGAWYNLTTGALLGMAGNTVVTGTQALLQTNNVVSMPTSQDQLTFSKKLQLAAVGYAPNSLTFSNDATVGQADGLGQPRYDASIWDQYKKVDMSQNADASLLVAGRSTRQTSVAGF